MSRSHADLGGTPDSRPVQPENEPLFHEPWEARVFALTLAMGATRLWNLDRSRATRETLPDYAALSYYEIWLNAVERLCIETGAISPAELADGCSRIPALCLPYRLLAADVPAVLARGSPTQRTAQAPARFAVGDAVRTRATACAGHTRLPGYARGRAGVIERIHGAHVFPDSNALGRGEEPQWLYTVVLEARELWNGAVHQISVDAFEPYLEPA